MLTIDVLTHREQNRLGQCRCSSCAPVPAARSAGGCSCGGQCGCGGSCGSSGAVQALETSRQAGGRRPSIARQGRLLSNLQNVWRGWSRSVPLNALLMHQQRIARLRGAERQAAIAALPAQFRPYFAPGAEKPRLYRIRTADRVISVGQMDGKDQTVANRVRQHAAGGSNDDNVTRALRRVRRQDVRVSIDRLNRKLDPRAIHAIEIWRQYLDRPIVLSRDTRSFDSFLDA